VKRRREVEAEKYPDEFIVVQENGLAPIRVATWGPFVLISLAESKASEGASSAEEGWLGSAGPVLTSAGINSSLQHVATREYVMNCNWKVTFDFAILCIIILSILRNWNICWSNNIDFCPAHSLAVMETYPSPV